MPNRIVREDILTSARVDELDPPAEVFYRRLLSKVDDHGLYDARPAILRASLFPLRIDRVREADCSRWMAACQKAGLIALYQADGRPYLQVMNTKWQVRSEPKYPLPSSANTCVQVISNVHLDVVVVEDVVVDVDSGPSGPVSRPKKAKKTLMPADFGISDRVKDWASREGYGELGRHLEYFRGVCMAKGYEYVDWDAAFMNAVRGDWAKTGNKPPTNGVQPAQLPRLLA